VTAARPAPGRRRILDALAGRPVDRAPVCNPTSVATTGLMDLAGAAFPGAHRDPEPMARLAAAGHTVLGFDSVMPVFSIVQEASALGCAVDWGERGAWPVVLTKEPLCRTPDDIRVPAGFLDHPDLRCILGAIRALKQEFGERAAVIGKAMGPWTLAYQCFGLEPFLLLTVDDPAMARRSLARLKEVTVLSALAQAEAGADALTLPDHATGDLVRASYYADFLLDIHAELRERIPVPVILHICGRTLDRMDFIARTGMAAFHFDSKNPPREAVAAAAGRIRLVGNVNNPVTLLRRGPDEVRHEVWECLRAGVELIGPECAVPLDTPTENLQEIARAVRAWRGGAP
jgi:[methyl-Co(III) methanol-specific corrinoid protein]:coenzyme M methyltransferase